MTSFYPRLLVFGLRPSGEDVPLEGELQKCFARSLPFFHELVEFQSELRGVIVNLVQQLEAIYTIDAAHVYSSFACHLRSVFSSLVNGFAVLVTLDEIIAQNLSIGHSMSLFTRFVPLDHCLIVPGLGSGLICAFIPHLGIPYYYLDLDFWHLQWIVIVICLELWRPFSCVLSFHCHKFWLGRMLHSVRSDPSTFSMEPMNVEQLDRAVNEMDSILITGIFQVPTFYGIPFPFVK